MNGVGERNALLWITSKLLFGSCIRIWSHSSFIYILTFFFYPKMESTSDFDQPQQRKSMLQQILH